MWYKLNKVLFALKNWVMLMHTTTSLTPEDITLSEISQLPKNKHCMSLLIKGAWGSHVGRDGK